MFGITEEKADKLIKQFRHAEIETDKFTDLASMVQLENSGEIAYMAYLFGGRIERVRTEELMRKVAERFDID